MSHNRMQTFFSGTDINTLYSEGDEQNHFVSLIINNAGLYNAAITRKVKGERKTVTTGTESLTYKSFNNVEKVINSQPFRSEATQEVYRLEYYMMNVEIETNVSYERNPLDIRLDELQASSKSYINKSVNIVFKREAKEPYWLPYIELYLRKFKILSTFPPNI